MAVKILERRIMILRIIACLFFVVGIAMSFKVWHADRLFPTLPVFDLIPSFSAETSSFFAVMLLIGLLLGSIIQSRIFFVGLLLMLLLILLQDQMRWQPWVYIYVAFLIPFALWKKPDKRLLSYFQFLLIGIYLWSGIFKFEGTFVEFTFDKMLRTLLFIEDAGTRQSLHFLGYGIPLIEILIAAGLFFKRSRKIAIFFAILTHLIILTYVISNDQNSVIYPWNVAMILLVVVAFYKTENSLFFWKEGMNRVNIQIASGALFFVLFPALNPLGLWDNYLSFKLYSGTNGAFCVGLDQDQYKKVDAELQQYFWKVDEPKGKYWIYVNLWAMDELNVAFYPEERTFRKLVQSFCEVDIPQEKLEFVIFREGFSREGTTVLRCSHCD